MSMNSQTKGNCVMCNATYSKGGMTRHFPKCIDAHKRNVSAPDAYLICAYAGSFWVYFEVPVSATLKDVDEFLRDLWLECCGHLSQFTIHDELYDISPDDDDCREDLKSMDYPLKNVVEVGTEFMYEYDFGTTTELGLKVFKRHKLLHNNKKEPIRILARNEPPEFPCITCSRQSDIVCVECLWRGAGWLCKDCKEKHGCDEDMFLPIVNSPRVGMCGYTG